MDQLRIKDLEVYAYHGVFPAEKELGQRFVLDLWVDYEMTRAARTGDLEASIHYGILAEQLTEWMQAEKIDLIETVAFQLVQKIFESYSGIAFENLLHQLKGHRFNQIDLFCLHPLGQLFRQDSIMDRSFQITCAGSASHLIIYP